MVDNICFKQKEKLFVVNKNELPPGGVFINPANGIIPGLHLLDAHSFLIGSILFNIFNRAL